MELAGRTGPCVSPFAYPHSDNSPSYPTMSLGLRMVIREFRVGEVMDLIPDHPFFPGRWWRWVMIQTARVLG
jgi:hypothetical protein